MAQELDIFQDTAAAEDLFADSTMQAEAEETEEALQFLSLIHI